MKKIFTILCLFLFSGVFNLTAQLTFEKPFGTYKLTSGSSTGACITENAGQLTSPLFSDLPGQSWTITQVDSQNSLYRVSIGNRVLTASGRNVILSAANGSNSQIWEIRGAYDGRSRYYKIRLKATNLFLVFSDSKLQLKEQVDGESDIWVINHTALYLVGGATPGGWDQSKAISMKSTENSEMTEWFGWQGYLVPGEFKINPLKSSWAQALNACALYPDEEYSIETTGPNYHSYCLNFNYENDYKFKITKAGYYAIGINLSDFKPGKVVNIQEWRPVYNIVGSATPKGWDNINAEEMAYNHENGHYIWKGFLKAGELKFLSRLNTWNYGIWATSPNESVVSGHPHSIFVGSNAPDNKFIISTDGNYIVDLDIETKTMVVKKEEPIYLVGDATPKGWNNISAEAMDYNDSTGCYTWTGYLKPGELKFLSRLGSWDQGVWATFPNELVVCGGYPHSIFVGSNAPDNKFRIPSSGVYTIELDLKAKTMLVWNMSAVQSFYLTGDATPKGWNNTSNEQEMNQVKGAQLFWWTGDLKPGHFKFITQLGAWNSLVPARSSHETVIDGYSHTFSSQYRGDYHFVINKAGCYSIWLDLEKGTVMVSKYESEQRDPIYLIGDATPAGWNNTAAIAMLRNNEDTNYTWTGTLKPGHFKFITQLGTWNSLVPVLASNQPVEVGKTYGLTNDYRGDYRFVVSTAGTYTITVNLQYRTLVINPVLKSATGLDSPGSEVPFTVISRSGSVEVVLNGNAAGSVSLYSLQGSLLDREQGSGSMVLGRGLASGAYVVTVQIDDKFYSQKIVVR